ncbi:MAG TPA: sugar transferase [Allosphingosinicella sp.]|jgi:lipopolysaccharide/colanic/teichoic acid biosynthesis glycosyltransferase
MSPYDRGGKRLIDLAVASAALLVLSPLLALLALLVAVKLGRPVLFYQERTGWKRRPFRIVKFRSMLDERDAAGNVLPEEARLTPFGARLRAWSLDELPSLWNILKGEMSIVGPRPFMHQYDRLYTETQARRFEVRPGITGWAQINGRNAISWLDKFAYDVWYVDNRSFLLDLRIIFATVLGVLTRRGINSADAATMPLFQGEPDQGHSTGPAPPAKD